MLTFLPPLHTDEENRRFITEMVPVDHEMWVAEEDGRVVGLAAVGDGRSGISTCTRTIRAGASARSSSTSEGAAPGRLHALDVPAERGGLPVLRARTGCTCRARGDGSGNEEGLPDVQYEWSPTP